MYYVGRAETLRGSSPLWNTWWIGGWPSANGSASYPTVTADQDLDFAFSFQTFQGGSSQTPYTNWYEAKGFVTNLPGIQSPPLLGYGISSNQTSSGAYTGCSSVLHQRWGDYVTTIWDSSYSAQAYPSPSRENAAFWTVSEFTTGASNQSTNWVSLADPLPFFAGYSVPSSPGGTYDENECGISGTTCHLIYSVPPNAQPGDLLLAEIEIGENTNISYLSLPAGWVALGMANDHGYYALRSTDGYSWITSFLAAYVYGSQSNDSGTYEFGIKTQTGTSELLGFLFSYRGATTNPSNVVTYGYSVSNASNTASVGAVTPGGQTTLADLFADECYTESPEGTQELAASFTAPSSPPGTPAVIAETPLSSSFPFLVADAGVPTAGSTYGPYSTKTCTGVNFGYEVVVPEL